VLEDKRVLYLEIQSSVGRSQISLLELYLTPGGIEVEMKKSFFTSIADISSTASGIGKTPRKRHPDQGD